MQSKDLQLGTQKTFSRRGLIKGTALAALASSSHSGAQESAESSLAEDSSEQRFYFAYIGTYTGAIGSGGNGQGIYLYRMNASNGRLSLIKVVSEVASPSWIAFDPSRTHLYAVNEVSNFNGTNGSVSSFAINRSNGDLVFLNRVSSEGAGPAHLSVDVSGKFVLVANYGGGNIAVLPILSDGSLGSMVDTRQDVDSLGPKQATNAPPGSFAISGHEAPHAHVILTDPTGNYLLYTDLAQDRIYSYRFDKTTGTLSGENFVLLPPGDGPRHVAFHPNGMWLYSIQEEASTITYFQFDPNSGSLMAQQTISTLPRRFTGTNFTSEIMVSPDGRFVYAANRLHDTIAVFSIDESGGLTRVGESSTLGDYPRSFNIDPTGKFFYVCNQRSDAVTCFRIDSTTGLLTFTGQYTPVGSPAGIIFLT
ncbi:MAG: lactonase family protein [Bryobacteraceae bacterium]